MIEALILKRQGGGYMKNCCGGSISSQQAEITFLQGKGGDIAATWLANCQRENVRIVIKKQQVLTGSVGFGFTFQGKNVRGRF